MLSDMKTMAENEALLQGKIRVLERDLEGALGGTDSQVHPRPSHESPHVVRGPGRPAGSKAATANALKQNC